MAGYRWIVQGQYDEVYRETTPQDAARRRAACAPYLERVLAALDLPCDGRYLDVGCGDGFSALAVAARAPRVHVLGVDASPRAVAAATSAARAEGIGNAAFVEGDAEAPPDGPFDRIAVLSVFNLLPGKRDALRAWRRVAAPGARLVIADAFRSAGSDAETTGALTEPSFVDEARAGGWRVVAREDLTLLVHRLHGAGAWPWSEYVRASAPQVDGTEGPRKAVAAGGFTYVLFSLQAMR